MPVAVLSNYSVLSITALHTNEMPRSSKQPRNVQLAGIAMSGPWSLMAWLPIDLLLLDLLQLDQDSCALPTEASGMVILLPLRIAA